MDLSLRPQQRPEHRLHTVTIEEIVSLGNRWDETRPPLENYFSPSRREQFEKEYIHYLNTLLLEVKHGNLDLDLYLVFVLTFQFIAPLLGIPAERELGQFWKILEQKYDMEELDINLHFSTDQYVAPPGTLSSPREEDSFTDDEVAIAEYEHAGYEDEVEGELSGFADKNGRTAVEENEAAEEDETAGKDDGTPDRENGTPNREDRHAPEEGFGGGSSKTIGEKEALSAFRQELDATWKGSREVKSSVQKRLKQDGIRSIMKWQQEKDFPELAEAFGRCVVIPSFFSFRDRKLLDFYRRTTEGITYEVAVPEIV